MMIELILYPALIGILLASIGGPLGSLIIWQRMAYFCESIAHSALLGVALGVLFNINLLLMIAAVCCAMALLLNGLHKRLQLSLNTLLAIMAHTSLATGLVIVSLIPGFRFNIDNFLFGDLLMLNQRDFIAIAAVCSLALLFLLSQWPKLIALITNEELAFVEGLPTQRLQLALMIVMALVIAVGIKAVGVLLIVSLLIIPAATARKWVNSPEGMAATASIIGVGTVVLGLLLSYFLDTPAGPSIVAISGGLYFISQGLLLTKNYSVS